MTLVFEVAVQVSTVTERNAMICTASEGKVISTVADDLSTQTSAPNEAEHDWQFFHQILCSALESFWIDEYVEPVYGSFPIYTVEWILKFTTSWILRSSDLHRDLGRMQNSMAKKILGVQIKFWSAAAENQFWLSLLISKSLLICPNNSLHYKVCCTFCCVLKSSLSGTCDISLKSVFEGTFFISP